VVLYVIYIIGMLDIGQGHWFKLAYDESGMAEFVFICQLVLRMQIGYDIERSQQIANEVTYRACLVRYVCTYHYAYSYSVSISCARTLIKPESYEASL